MVARGVIGWCGFCGCQLVVFSFDFLHEGRYRLPPGRCPAKMSPTIIVDPKVIGNNLPAKIY